MTLLPFCIHLELFYAGLREIVAYKKDPDLLSTHALMLVYCICGTSLATVLFLTYIFKKMDFVLYSEISKL